MFSRIQTIKSTESFSDNIKRLQDALCSADAVVIGAGAKVLGSITIGDNSKVAAGAVVLCDVPPNSTAVGVPARIVKRDGQKTPDLDQVHIPDPVSQELCRLQAQIDTLRAELKRLEKKE